MYYGVYMYCILLEQMEGKGRGGYTHAGRRRQADRQTDRQTQLLTTYLLKTFNLYEWDCVWSGEEEEVEWSENWFGESYVCMYVCMYTERRP